VFSGRDGAPRIVAVLPLCADADARDAIRRLNGSLDIEAELAEGAASVRVPVDRFKQKLQYLPLRRDLTTCLDAARVADFVVVVLSATTQVDPLGELILRSVESQGMSTLYTVVHGMEAIESPKQRTGVLNSLKSYITHFHPGQEKLFSLDNRQECSNLMRSLCSTTPKGVHWRDERSWMLVEEVTVASSPSEPTVLTGVVRGRGLNADRPVQLGDVGTFRIQKITAAPLARPAKRGDGMAVDEDVETVLQVPGSEPVDLAELAPEEVDMADDDMYSMAPSTKKGVLLDDHHYFSGEEDAEERDLTKRVPKGTSRYQAAWYLGDEEYSDEGSDFEDIDMKEEEEDDDDDDDDDESGDEARPEDGIEGLRAPTEMMDTASEFPQSEAPHVDPTDEEDAQQLAAYRSQRRTEMEDDREFPDEIELQPNVLARERLARYRGLKSLRTSRWDEDEDRPYEPADFRRLLEVRDYKAARSAYTREALAGGVPVGTRVRVYLEGVPAEFAGDYSPANPVTLFSLLRHEHKKTVANYLVSLSSDYPTSIKAKEEFVVQCGPRRFVARPLFSEPGSTENDVHKYSRFLHPGQTAVASFMAPVTWGSVPTLFFKRTTPDEVNENGDKTPGLALVATGSALAPSTSRVVVKRVVLTGHPYHINKKVVTIRYMFFNRDDVQWFKALPLWTRRGRGGYIKEPVGTHGYFKATFDGRLNPQDAVGVSLYKRVFPRDSFAFGGKLLETGGEGEGAVDGAMEE
jgi:pre-rRNA-processing protein TSR1